MCIASYVDALVPMPQMGRAKFRTLKELYQYSTQQGSLSLPTQPSKIEMEEKSRSCNLCATWCSSCVPFERVAATVGVRTGGFTDKTYEEERTSWCSSNDGILSSPSLSAACDCKQHTSSEASNILSVSSSHNSLTENAESQSIFRDSDSCKDVELLFKVRKPQPCRGSGDTPKGLSNFDDQRFSNQIEKHNQLEILGDNISCISRSESANLAIANQNGGPDRKNVSCRSASEDSFPVVEKDVNERLFFTFLLQEEPSECSSEQVESSLARAAISRLGSQIDGIYSCATFAGADPHLNCETESHSNCKKHLQKYIDVIKNTSMQESWQTQQAEPRAVSDLMEMDVTVCDICGDAGQEKLLAICNKCTDGAEHIYCMCVKLNKVPEVDWMCEECQKSKSPVNLESWSGSKLKFRSSHAWKRQTEGVSSTSHLSAKKHGIPLEAQSMKKGRVVRMSAQPTRSSKPCYNSLLRKDLSCKNFKNGKVKAAKDITSELRISCNSQEKAKVPHGCGDKRHACTLEAELDKKGRALETRITFPKASKPSNQSLLSREPPFKMLGNSKLEPAHSVSSLKQSSYDSQEKPKLGKVKLEAAHSASSVKQPKLPSYLGDESPKLGSQAVIARDKCSLLKSGSSKAADLKFKGQLAKDGCLQKQKVERNLALHDIRKGKDLRMVSKFMSFNSVSSEKSNATCSEVILANAYRPMVFQNSSSAAETKTAKGKYASELHNPAMCLLASDSGVTAVKSENKTISCDETFFSGSNFCRLDAVQSCGQLDCRLQPNSHNAHKDLYCPNEEKKNESWQAERPTEAATAMKLHKLCTSLGSVERSQFEAAILSEDCVIPKPNFIWLGKFQIHRRSKGIVSTCDGIQAHLSTYASQKVFEVVDRLPEIIALEELPRMRMWPSQFMESQATEENIALYFFAKDFDSYKTYRGLMEYMTKNDLALRGNLDGVELLIFPSNFLPEKSQCWNKLSFLWGVFRGQKVNSKANTPVSNSQKRENRDTASSWALDLNAYPEDGNDMVRVDEIGKFDSIGTSSSGDRILVGGDSYNSGCSDLSQALDEGVEKRSQSVVPDIELPLWPKIATPNDGHWLSVGNVGNKIGKDVHGKLPMEEKNNVDNVEVHGKLPMTEKNNADNVETSRLPSHSLVLHTKENLDLLHAAVTLFFMSP